MLKAGLPSYLSNFLSKYNIFIHIYPAQQDNLDTSLSKVRAANFKPSAIVKYGARLSFKSSTVNPNLTAKVAA